MGNYLVDRLHVGILDDVLPRVLVPLQVLTDLLVGILDNLVQDLVSNEQALQTQDRVGC